MVYLTFDQDWAPAFATQAAIAAAAGAGVPATLFVTHDCPSLSDARSSGVELGWHPNFLPGSSHGSTMDEVLRTLAGIVPEAQGVRAHCLVGGTPYLRAYRERGIRYDASDLHDGVGGLAPFASFTGVVQIPIFFEDDVHLHRGLPCDVEALDLGGPGLRVLSFHPVLVALNAADPHAWPALKARLHRERVPLSEASPEHFADPRPEAAARNGTGRSGIGDLFRAVLAWLARHPEQCGGTLGSLVGG